MPRSLLSGLCVVFAIMQDFCFNPSASPFLPTTCLSFASGRLNAMHSETYATDAHLQPAWNQSNWNNVYQPDPRLIPQQYDATINYALEDVDPRSGVFEQQGALSCPVDWYLDNTGSHQALQSLPSLQVCYILLWALTTVNCYLHCVWKKHQLWNGVAQNYTDRFWWHLAETFKIRYFIFCVYFADSVVFVVQMCLSFCVINEYDDEMMRLWEFVCCIIACRFACCHVIVPHTAYRK